MHQRRPYIPALEFEAESGKELDFLLHYQEAGSVGGDYHSLERQPLGDRRGRSHSRSRTRRVITFIYSAMAAPILQSTRHPSDFEGDIYAVFCPAPRITF